MKPTLEAAMLTPALPAHLIALVDAEWLARLPLVQAEIAKRQAHQQPTNPAHFQARHWHKWLARHALDIPVMQEVAA